MNATQAALESPGPTPSAGPRPISNAALEIKRADLVTIVERAINPLRLHYSEDEVERLIEIARTTPKVVFGDWKIDEVGCPLTQARIVRFSGADLFAETFDADITEYLLMRYSFHEVPHYGVLEVVD